MSMQNMEIIIPSEKSEIELLTAGKYCAKDITVKSPLGFKTVKGTFTLPARLVGSADGVTPGDKLTISGIPSNAFIVEVWPDKAIPADVRTFFAPSPDYIQGFDLYADFLCFDLSARILSKREDANRNLLCSSFFQHGRSGGFHPLHAKFVPDENGETGSLVYTLPALLNGTTVAGGKEWNVPQMYNVLSHTLITNESGVPVLYDQDGNVVENIADRENHQCHTVESEEQITYTWKAYCWDV